MKGYARKLINVKWRMLPYKRFFKHIKKIPSVKYNKIYNKLIDDFYDRNKIRQLKLTLYNE